MSQNDFSIADQPGASFLSELNSQIQALATLSSGPTAPTTTYAYQFWYDTTNNLLKIRNGGNTQWITIGNPATDTSVDMYVANALRARLNATGLGVGVASPAYALDVLGDVNVTGAFRLGGIPALFKSANIQTFTASGTYTPTTGTRICIVEGVGGGGGGGGVSTSSSTIGRGGGGGGGAGYFRRILDIAAIGASQSVTVGAAGAGGGAGGAGGNGGTTSFGSIATATGGLGGAAGGFGVPSLGGAPGSFTGANFGTTGSTGGSGIAVDNANWGAKGGDGGSSFLGLGGIGLYVAGGFGARSGTGRGSGGSGAATSFGATSATGGDGTDGIILITEFLA